MEFPITTINDMAYFRPSKKKVYLIQWVADHRNEVISYCQLEAIIYSALKWNRLEQYALQFHILRFATADDLALFPPEDQDELLSCKKILT